MWQYFLIQSKKTTYAAINGYEQNGLQRGLNIIRMSDGTVKKVMVK